MEIREVQIDGFGVFSARKLKGLTSGLNIIYGPNEFGKTTLLEFIRCVLFGFPGKNQRVNQYTPVNGGCLGGGLQCVLA
ncbi:MAG: AAA family ATPase, partial [Nitrospina sp.]|nr:AAA family ATPase [Nitrospina sp.]